jgi:hypothetical protein
MYDELDIDDYEDCEETDLCETCGRRLKVGFEEYETYGFVSRERVLYCPNCD